jgi:hypothetical protein
MHTITKIKIHASIFIFFVIVFTLLYRYVAEFSLSESIYTSLSFQTFTGCNVDNDTVKAISSVQMFSSYIFVIVIMYSILHL